MFKSKKTTTIISMDIKSTSTNYDQYVREEQINCITQLLFHSLGLYPPHAKVESPGNKAISITHLSWFISYKHFKLIQDIFETIILSKSNTNPIREKYYYNCIELLFYELVTCEDGGMSLQGLLKDNRSKPPYFSKTKPWILILKIKFYLIVLSLKKS